jgi:hypothetical protein
MKFPDRVAAQFEFSNFALLGRNLADFSRFKHKLQRLWDE